MHREQHPSSADNMNAADLTAAGAGTGFNDPVDPRDETSGLSVSAAEVTPIEATELVHERLRRFMKLLPDLLTDERVEAVHDLRVWSRRLQQVVVTMFPKV